MTAVRNIGIMAHVDAGRTTLTERILFNTGRIHRVGDVHTGNTEMDSHALERKHGITISAAATTCQWRDVAITILDTPGHVDFQLEVERSLRVLDGAVAVFSAVAGVQPQSETVWRQADRFVVPRLCFVNKMDQLGADFDRTVAMIADRLGASPLTLQAPIGAERSFFGVVDLVRLRALLWQDGEPSPCEGPVPEPMLAEAQARRASLLERLAEADEAVLARFIDAPETLDESAILAGIRRATLAGRLTPVLAGSAYRNIGVQPLLGAIVAFCPAPQDRPPVEGIDPRDGSAQSRPADAEAPFTALVSKVEATRFGALSVLRIYAGRLLPGDTVLNPRIGRVERVGRLLRLHADAQTEIDRAEAGDVVAVVGLKAAAAGDTLCDPARPIRLAGLVVPAPVIEAVVAPATTHDADRLGEALVAMTRSDPSLQSGVHAETGQTLLRGLGELHLQIAVETLKEDFGVPAVIGAPQVAYRCAPTRTAVVDHTLRKQSGGQGQMARVKLALEPLPEGESGLVFENRTVGGSVPKAFVPAVEAALEAAMARGGLGDLPVVGMKAVLLDGAFHVKDSSAMAFARAADEAFRIGFPQTCPVALEPLMRVVVTAPADCVGGVIGDLLARRGQIVSSEPIASGQEVTADVPLGELFAYVGALRSLTQGRGDHSLTPSRYAPLPRGLWSRAGVAAPDEG